MENLNKKTKIYFGILVAVVLVFVSGQALAEIRATTGTANFAGADALCKAEFGSNWAFATIDNTDEAYMNSNFSAGRYIIANAITAALNSPWDMNICPNDRTWPEPQKEAIFDKDASFCYGDVPKTQAYRIVCRGSTVSVPTVTCSANPSTITAGGSITWSATATGGTGSYTYSWVGTDSLSGNGSSISKTYNNSGTKYATVVVTSGSQNATANCSATVNAAPSNLSATCSANPSFVNSNQTVVFNVTPIGGTGTYTYSWSGACTGSASTCSNTISGSGNQTANIAVTSGSQTVNTSCSVYVNQTCTQNYQQRCYGSNVYWYDSCGNLGSFVQYCPNGCVNNACQNNQTCTQNYQQRCNGNYLYWYDSCGNQGSYIGTCGGSTCTQNYQQRCYGSNVYWYDSCGNLGSFVQYCPNGCVNNACQNYNYNTNGYLTVTKTVKNLTRGTTFANSTTANPSDVLMYMITLQASSNDVQNVVIRDVLSPNLTYKSQMVVARTNYSYNNYSGDIITGLNLYTISSGQTVTVTYQAQVADTTNLPYSNTTLDNNTYTTTSNSGNVPLANAPVTVTRPMVLGASTVSTGLTNNFWVDSFMLPLLIAVVIVALWKMGFFLGIEKWLDIKKNVRHEYTSQKELSGKIQRIKKYEEA